jgi:AraC-like DNA-binding protein
MSTASNGRSRRRPVESARSPVIPGRPSALLGGVVARDYAGFTEGTSPKGGFVLPATASVPVIVKIQDSALRPPVFVNGPHDHFMTVAGICAPSYLELWLAPLGAYRILGLPIDTLPGEPVDLVDVLGTDGRRLGEQVRDLPSWQERFALVDEFLLERMDHGRLPSPEVGHAMSVLVQSRGRKAIGQLAADTGWSHKHLITQFKRQVGMTPKMAARLIRFETVRRRLARGSHGWARIAAEAGYSDQSHLVREFRQFSGLTPTAFVEGNQSG